MLSGLISVLIRVQREVAFGGGVDWAVAGLELPTLTKATAKRAAMISEMRNRVRRGLKSREPVAGLPVPLRLERKTKYLFPSHNSCEIP